MQLRCGTFNLFQFVEPPFAWYEPQNIYSDTDWILKKGWIKEQLSKMNCDIVGFQEVFSISALKELVKNEGFTYFETVESPTVDTHNNFVYVKPVVAICSKYPITLLKPLNNFEDGFEFTRIPIKAQIAIEGIGEIIVYVVHLKSKLPLFETISNTSDTWDNLILKTLQARSMGYVSSAFQRGKEATELYREITDTLKLHNNIPFILLGDLNDNVDSIPIESLTNREKLFEINGINYSTLPDETKALKYKYTLYDTFDMAPNPSGQRRVPTHYYRNYGDVIDYIFVSNSLNEKNPQHNGRVIFHEVFDLHLKSDGVSDSKQSDHAQVVTTIDFSNT